MTKPTKSAGKNGTIPADLRKFLSDNDARIRNELFDFLRIPSVSAKSEHNADTKRAAEWVKSSLDSIGVPAKIYPTAGHPVVVGEWRNAPGAPTVLIYGHYDVQPAEPLDLWTSPPFEPTVRDGKIFARGSVDDKGQLFLHIKALEAHLATRGRLPVNVVVIAEGEEEIGSEHLASFVKDQKKLLKSDAVVISDSFGRAWRVGQAEVEHREHLVQNVLGGQRRAAVVAVADAEARHPDLVVRGVDAQHLARLDLDLPDDVVAQVQRLRDAAVAVRVLGHARHREQLVDAAGRDHGSDLASAARCARLPPPWHDRP